MDEEKSKLVQNMIIFPVFIICGALVGSYVYRTYIEGSVSYSGVFTSIALLVVGIVCLVRDIRKRKGSCKATPKFNSWIASLDEKEALCIVVEIAKKNNNS